MFFQVIENRNEQLSEERAKDSVLNYPTSGIMEYSLPLFQPIPGLKHILIIVIYIWIVISWEIWVMTTFIEYIMLFFPFQKTIHNFTFNDKLRNMKIKIVQSEGQSIGRINLSQFEKNAKKIFTKEVQVQIKRAKNFDKPTNVTGCNNPV